MILARYPRIKLGHWPTPLEPMPNLTKHLGGPNLWVKRDDCTGLAVGGNKTRKLEFLIADALEQGANHILTQGAVQSNHVRQTAAAAMKFGLACSALLEGRIASPDDCYLNNGNVLLDRLMGIELEHRPGGTDMQQALEDLAEDLKRRGKRPYVIPGGGSNRIGALGYVTCAFELVMQANEMGLVIDLIVLATGSAGTQAGLVAGLTALNCDIPVLGISVRAEKAKQEANVFQLAQETAEHLGLNNPIERNHVVADSNYVGEGYGIPTQATIDAIKLLARQEGLLFDPVYTGKGLAGLIDLARKGEFAAHRNVVFLHTGGSPGLFGYQDALQVKPSIRG